MELGHRLETSPCDRLSTSKLIGERKPRQRVLNDAELRAFWRATATLGYPFGPLFQFLLLTGQRRNEVVRARWREFDLTARLWIVPPERFKSDAVHTIPITDAALALLGGMPRFTGGDFMFSCKRGKSAS
jgi:integrase